MVFMVGCTKAVVSRLIQRHSTYDSLVFASYGSCLFALLHFIAYDGPGQIIIACWGCECDLGGLDPTKRSRFDRSGRRRGESLTSRFARMPLQVTKSVPASARDRGGGAALPPTKCRYGRTTGLSGITTSSHQNCLCQYPGRHGLQIAWRPYVASATRTGTVRGSRLGSIHGEMRPKKGIRYTASILCRAGKGPPRRRLPCADRQPGWAMPVREELLILSC